MRIRVRGCAMTTPMLAAGRARLLFPTALPLLVVAGAPAPVLAQSERGSVPELNTADDEFSRQLSELKKSFADLSKKFDESAEPRPPQQRRGRAQGDRGAARPRRQAARCR